MKNLFLKNSARQNQKQLCLFFLFIVFCLIATPAFAHKVHLFAYADGGLIKTEARFSGDRPARNCDIAVRSSNRQEIAVSGQSDEKGFFDFPVADLSGDLDISITCGDGHRGAWHLAQSEYLGEEVPPAADHTHSETYPDTAAKVAGKNEDMLRQIIAEEVEKKLSPVRRELAKLNEKRTSLQDILGGIGYILGLAGLAAYMRFKKSK